jgi:tetratricopeptide (TPR) repeat protein
MAIAVNSGTQTSADELRTLLTHCEDCLAKLHDRSTAAALYAGMDKLAEMWPAIRQTGVDVRGEWTRWETLQATLQRHAAKVLAAWGGRQALADARTAAAPAASRWWWWVDEVVAKHRRSRVVKTAGIFFAVIGVIVLGAMLFNRLFPVDEAVREAYRLRTDAETAMMNGDYAAALIAMERAVAARPEDATLQIMLGVLAEHAGDQATAAQAWSTARTLLQGKEDIFLAERGLAYGQLNQLDRSVQDELAAIALTPNLARAHLYLGAAYEAQGKTTEALAAYTRAGELAGDADPELTVLARTRIGALLQQAPPPIDGSP